MIKQITLGIISGTIVTLFIAQFDPWVQKRAGEHIQKMLADSLHCSVSGTVHSVNFLMPEIIFENFHVSDASDDPQWQWHAKEYSTGFSWFHFFISGKINFWINLKDLAIKSTMSEHGIAVTPHFYDLMKPPQLAIPLILESVTIRNGTFECFNAREKNFFAWNGSSKKMRDFFRSHFYVTNGFMYKDKRIVENVVGTVTLDSFDKNEKVVFSMRTDLQLDVPGLSEHPTCFWVGSWNQTHGRFSLESSDQSLLINPIVLKEKNNMQLIEATAHIPLSYIGYLATDYSLPLDGSASIQLKGSLSSPVSLDVQMSCEDIKHWLLNDTAVIRCNLHKKDNNWIGNLGAQIRGISSFVGSGSWDERKKNGSFSLSNNNKIIVPSYPYWTIDKKDCSLKFTMASDGTIQSFYKTIVKNELLDTQLTSTGAIEGNSTTGAICVHGVVGEQSFELEGDMNSFPFIVRGAYYDLQKKPLIQVEKQKDCSCIETSCAMPVVRALIAHIFQYDLHGEGMVHIASKYSNNTLFADVHLADSTIRLSQTYNFINGLDAHIEANFAKKSMVIKDVSCTLHTGSLSSLQAIISLDEHGVLSFVHIPVSFERCLLNVKQDLFAMVSGSLLLSKLPNKTPLLKGNLILDRAQIKENLFSDVFQKKLFQATDKINLVRGMELDCDLTVETKDVVRVDTDFLQATAHMNLSIKKQLLEPEITGKITLLSGVLSFPYKPLHISKGSLAFLSEQPLNPVVELVAKNTIKQHNVALHVTGSLQDHLVLLESTPPLTEEQIVGLLLAGSHEEALSNVLPALLVHNIANLIFSSHQSSALERYFKPWMKHINVQLVPRLSEQSGRGGLRGAIEIDVNERWRALIEKNFSLTEDTRFELEYTVSDDVRLRVIRDERCDVGGEVEMKWKF